QHTTSTERMQKLRDTKKRDVTGSDAVKRSVARGDAKTAKKAPDTDSRLQIADSDAETQKKQISDKKIRARAEGEREREKTNLPDDIAEQMLQIWNAEVQNKLTK